jgi:hypothetical protein
MALWKLQLLDIEISKLNLRIEAIPKELQKASLNFNLKESELSERQKKSSELMTQKARLDQDIQQSKDTVKRYKGQLLQVKTNKEYQSLLHEINTEETKISAFDILTQIEDLSKSIELVKEALTIAKTNFQALETNLNAEANKLTATLSIKNIERDKISSLINKPLLMRYEQVKKGRGGIGIVKILNYTCTGCNTVIPPQFVAEIKKCDKLITCEQCGRVLVSIENVT